MDTVSYDVIGSAFRYLHTIRRYRVHLDLLQDIGRVTIFFIITFN